MRPRLIIYRRLVARRSQRWRWRLRANNGPIVAVSSEGYANQAECEEMAMRVVSGAFGNAKVERP